MPLGCDNISDVIRLVPLFALALAVPSFAAPRVDLTTLPAIGPAQMCVTDKGANIVMTSRTDMVMVRAGNGWFRATLPGGCPALTPNRIIVRRTTMSQLCRNDVFEVVDPMGPGMSYGLCRFGMLEPMSVPRGARF